MAQIAPQPPPAHHPVGLSPLKTTPIKGTATTPTTRRYPPDLRAASGLEEGTVGIGGMFNELHRFLPDKSNQYNLTDHNRY